MKFILFFSLSLLLAGVTTAFSLPTDKPETATFMVSGVCGMCEQRIETAAMNLTGVKLADWDRKTQQITVVFNPKKASLDAIHQAIAAAGHDTDRVKAADVVYEALPGCCLYRDGVESH
ncbi:MAG: hypothetical protein OHK0039_08820 [Bacteroidia bacterium]